MHRLDRNTRNSRIRVYNFSLIFLYFYISLSLRNLKYNSHPELYSRLSFAAERVRGECIYSKSLDVIVFHKLLILILTSLSLEK